MINRLYPVYSLCCEIGDQRGSNQDRILAKNGTFGRTRLALFLVADGCGGLARGDKISQLLSDSFAQLWESGLLLQNCSSKQHHAYLSTLVCGWLNLVNQFAFDFGKEIQGRVGSTLSLLVIRNKKYYLYNVGDSRVYLKRNGCLTQLSEDQSYVADMVRNGEISEEEAAHSNKRNILTMCVGGYERVRVYQNKGRIRKGDVFLLCSDGLYGKIDSRRLENVVPDIVTDDSASVLRGCIPPGRASDNVSAILVQIRPGPVNENDF